MRINSGGADVGGHQLTPGATTVVDGDPVSVGTGEVAIGEQKGAPVRTLTPGDVPSNAGSGDNSLNTETEGAHSAVFTADGQTVTVSELAPGVFAIGSSMPASGQVLTLADGRLSVPS